MLLSKVETAPGETSERFLIMEEEGEQACHMTKAEAKESEVGGATNF